MERQVALTETTLRVLLVDVGPKEREALAGGVRGNEAKANFRTVSTANEAATLLKATDVEALISSLGGDPRP
jgi:hypothetical protein